MMCGVTCDGGNDEEGYEEVGQGPGHEVYLNCRVCMQVRYGTMSQAVTGLTAVLADGSVLRTGRGGGPHRADRPAGGWLSAEDR